MIIGKVTSSTFAIGDGATVINGVVIGGDDGEDEDEE